MISSRIQWLDAQLKVLLARKLPRAEATMRFQVQWDSGGSGPTFSSKRKATVTTGVLARDAQDALGEVAGEVAPERARHAASPAVDAQIRWVGERPRHGGVAQAGYSWSESFSYGNYDDARVDVENIYGHNLRA